MSTPWDVLRNTNTNKNKPMGVVNMTPRKTENAKERSQDIFEDDADTFYNEDEIEVLLEDDEISGEEEAFMKGYMDDDQ